MALNAGMFQVTKHAWRHPARLAHALALSSITQQSSSYHSSPQLSAAQPAAAAEAIAAAAATRTAAGFPPYDQLATRDDCPDGIVTRNRDRFDGRKMGQFAGLLLRVEPAGTICRLRALLKDTTLESAIATANVAALVHDTPSVKSSDAAHDSSSSNLMVLQTTQRQISAKGSRDLLKPGDEKFDIIDLDIFKIPKPLLTPLMDSTANTAAAVVGTSGSTDFIKQEVLTAIQAGKPAGPFAVVGYAAVSQLVQDITAVRQELLQDGSSSSSSSSSGDLLCRVDRAPADSTAEYQQAALAATAEGRNPPKFLYVITVYPCPRWPESPRLDRVAAVAAAAAAVA